MDKDILAEASAKIVDFDNTNKILYLTNLNGDFVPSLSLTGSLSHAIYSYNYSYPSANTVAKIESFVDPYNATQDSQWTANTIITEV